jgi:hypothetical protein
VVCGFAVARDEAVRLRAVEYRHQDARVDDHRPQSSPPDGVHAGHIALHLFIKPGAGEADPTSWPSDRAELEVGDYIEQAVATVATTSQGAHPMTGTSIPTPAVVQR